MIDLVLSLVILAALILLGGAFVIGRRGNRKQALLMVVLAAVMIANVAIWLVPTEGGESLVDAAAQGGE